MCGANELAICGFITNAFSSISLFCAFEIALVQCFFLASVGIYMDLCDSAKKLYFSFHNIQIDTNNYVVHSATIAEWPVATLCVYMSVGHTYHISNWYQEMWHIALHVHGAPESYTRYACAMCLKRIKLLDYFSLICLPLVGSLSLSFSARRILNLLLYLYGFRMCKQKCARSEKEKYIITIYLEHAAQILIWSRGANCLALKSEINQLAWIYIACLIGLYDVWMCFVICFAWCSEFVF